MNIKHPCNPKSVLSYIPAAILLQGGLLDFKKDGIMVISEPTPFVAGRFEKPLRFASNQQMQINIFSFFKKKTYSCCSVHVGLIPAQSCRQPPVISVINALEIVRVDLV